jgi:hypothetical protein
MSFGNLDPNTIGLLGHAGFGLAQLEDKTLL